MAKYKCNNKECNVYEKVSDDLPVWQRYKPKGVIDMNLKCPSCKEQRELVISHKKRGGFCTNIYGGNGNICNK